MNWKPPIHSWILLQFYELAGSKMAAYQYHYFVQLFFIGGGICLISYYLSQFRRIYSLSVLILLILTPWVMKVHIVGNDALFISCLLFALGIFLNSYKSKIRWMRYAGIGVFSILLFFVMSFRINSMPSLFILIVTLLYMNKCTMKRALFTSSIAIIGMLALQALIHHTYLRAEKGYPLNFLYISDMQNTSILKGEWIDFYKNTSDSQDNIAHFPPRDIPFAVDNVNFFKTPVSPYIKRTDANFARDVQAGWLQTLENHPKEVLICRLYAYQQFLLAGRSLWFINDWIKQSYPGTVIFFDHTHREWRNYLSSSFVMFSLLNFIVLAVGAFCLFMFIKKKRGFLKDEGIRVAILFSLFGWIYLLSFSPLTLSATEVRYYLPHSICFAYSLVLMFLYVCDQLRISSKKKI